MKNSPAVRFETILAIDFYGWAAETYRTNFPDVEVRCASVADQNALEAIPYADIYLGGPPCQPHSRAGKREASKDKRDCGPDFVGAVDFRQPRMFLMENVDGLMSSENGRYAQRLLKSMEDAGYVVQIRILDAVSFGVPQFRVRCWWWGIRADLYRDGMRHAWPKPTHAWPPPEACMFDAALEAGITVGQALGLDGCTIRRSAGPNSQQAKYGHDYTMDEPSPCVSGLGHEGISNGLILQAPAIRVRGGKRTGGHGHDVEDRDITDEPAQTVGDLSHGLRNGEPRVTIQSHAGPAQTINKPAPALRSGGGGHDGCCVRLQLETGSKNRYRRPGAESRGPVVHDLDEPSFCIDGTKGPDLTIGIQQGHGNVGDREFNLNEPAPTMRNCLPGCSDILLYRWSDAMLYKHPPASPASPASPAPTVQAKWFKGGAEGLLQWKKTPDGLWVRRLTPLECMRLQSAPDDFRWPDDIGKTAMYRVCGNGQASLMVHRLRECMERVDPDSRTVIDLFCGGGLGACGFHGRFWRYEHEKV